MVQQRPGRWSFRSSWDRSSCIRWSMVTSHAKAYCSFYPVQSLLAKVVFGFEHGLEDLMSWVVEIWFQAKLCRTLSASRFLVTRIAGPLMLWWEGCSNVSSWYSTRRCDKRMQNRSWKTASQCCTKWRGCSGEEDGSVWSWRLDEPSVSGAVEGVLCADTDFSGVCWSAVTQSEGVIMWRLQLQCHVIRKSMEFDISEPDGLWLTVR